MLSETESLWVDTNFEEELIYTGQEIAQRLICDYAFIHRLTNAHIHHLSPARSLDMSVQKNKDDVSHLMETLVPLVLRVHEVFYLRHSELTDTKQASPGRDLIAERPSDLRRSEWYATIIEIEQTREVEEMALRSLWTEVTRIEY